MELGDEGARVSGRRDEQADEEPAENAAGKGRLDGGVRVAREEDAVRELVDRVRAHCEHERKRRAQDVPQISFPCGEHGGYYTIGPFVVNYAALFSEGMAASGLDDLDSPERGVSRVL